MDDELGTALALMHRARGSLTTFECTLWTWTHHDRFRHAMEAVRDRKGAGGATVILGTAGGDDPRPASETEHRIWFSGPDRSREEGPYVTVVQRGDQRWSTPADPEQPVVEEDASRHPPLESISDLIDPRGLACAVDLTTSGRCTFDGREVIELTGGVHPHEGAMGWTVAVSLAGAEELLVSVDAQTGLLVRAERRFQGEPFQVQELRGLQTGHRISAARFEPDLPEGQEVISSEERLDRARSVRSDPPWPRRRRSFSEVMPAHPFRHEVAGPPPEDVDGARAAIQGALDAVFGPHDDDVPGVEGGQHLGPVLAAARERNIRIVDGASLRLVDSRFLHARLAEITFALVTTTGIGNGLQQQGFALEFDGEWQISRETLDALLRMGGVRLPPRTVGLDPHAS